MSARRNTLTPEQRLALADQIRQLIEDQYPQETFDGQEEALVLALIALTSTGYAKDLLGAAR
jgi:hypothetical protein